VRKAWGFQIEVVGHIASPAVRKAWSEVTGVAARRIKDGSMAFICELPVSNESRHFSFSGERVAAMRRLRNRRYRNPADPKVSHAQPPLHVSADTKKRRQS